MKKFKFKSKIIFLLFVTVVLMGFSFTYISIEVLYNIGDNVKKISTKILSNQTKQSLIDSNSLQAEKNDIILLSNGKEAEYLAYTIAEIYEKQKNIEADQGLVGTKIFPQANGVIIGRDDALSSLFSPAGTEINEAYLKDFLVADQINVYAEKILMNKMVVAVYFNSIRNCNIYYPNIGVHKYVPADFTPSERPWYVKATSPDNVEKKLIWTSVYTDAVNNGLLVTAAAPVYSKNSELLGVVGIDIKLDDVALAIGDNNSVKGGYYFLLDNDNNFIVLSDNIYGDIFNKISDNNVLGTSFLNVKSEFLPLIDSIKKNKKGSLMIKSGKKDFLLVYEKMKNIDWTLVSVVSSENYLLPLNEIELQVFGTIGKFVVERLFPLVLIVIILIVIVGALTADKLIKPLTLLTKKAQKIANEKLGQKINKTIEINNEMDALSSVIDSMDYALDKYKQKSEISKQELEKKVREKTRELEKILKEVKSDKKNLQKQRTATLNILEDVSDSQSKLEKMNKELSTRSDELTSLKFLSDEFVGAFDILEAVMVANKYLKKFLDFTSINYLVLNPAEDGVSVYTTYINQEVSEQYLRSTEKELISYINKNNAVALNSALKIIKNIAPKYLGNKLNNNIDSQPVAYAYFPLIIGKKCLGVIQTSTSKVGKIILGDSEFIKSIVLSLAFSVDRLETLMLAQHSKTVSLVESLTDGVVMFNSDKEVVLMNPAFVKYTGFSKEYFNLNDLYRLLPELKLKDDVNKALSLGKISHVDEASLVARFYELFITPVRDNKGTIVGGAIIIHDITYLQEISQMKTEFVSVASHQLRTPLTAIKLFTEMLIRGDVGKLNNEQQEYLENINESTERMVRLVNDLLNITRIESGRLAVKPQPVNVVKFINNIIAEAKPLIASRTQKIIFDNNNIKLNNVPLDENLIRQVFHNLVVNAIRYSSEKNGLIKIILNKKDNKNFIISVSDNGIGIPEKSQKRIFEKFYRADNAIKSVTEGTGLGLYVSKMIVESSDGKIWFQSSSKGTTFFVQLPIKGMKEKKGERGLAIS